MKKKHWIVAQGQTFTYTHTNIYHTKRVIKGYTFAGRNTTKGNEFLFDRMLPFQVSVEHLGSHTSHLLNTKSDIKENYSSMHSSKFLKNKAFNLKGRPCTFSIKKKGYYKRLLLAGH